MRAHASVNNLEGIGVAEAPRGTLIHHYKVDRDGLITWANLIIATGHNNAAMNRGVLQVARHFVHGNKLTEGMLNRVEAVIRDLRPVPELLDARRRAPCPGSRTAIARWRTTGHMSNTLIIGYGNALRGDDGAGYIVAELLRDRVHDPEIEIVSQHQLTPELMEPISRAAHVIFIDSSVSGRAGKVNRIPLRPAPSCSRFTHHVNSRVAAGRCAVALRAHARGDALHDPRPLFRDRR